MSTSIRYKILKFGISLLGTKKMFALPKEELLNKASVYNKKRGFRIPTDHKCDYGDREIMEHGQTVPEYRLSGVRGDFTGLPPINFYYGSDEVLYAEAEYFADACKKAGVHYTLAVGKGMCHCYPMAPFNFPEGKQAKDEIVRFLSN